MKNRRGVTTHVRERGCGFGSEGWSRRGCDYACPREGTLPVFSCEYILIEFKMTVGVYIIINK